MYCVCINFFKANGLDERWNQTLQNMLVKFVSHKRKSWSAYLDSCVFAYNTSRHESTKHTPFELMFGRTAALPIDINMEKKSAKDYAKLPLQFDEENHQQQQKKRDDLLVEVKKNIIAAQEKQKRYYDKKRANPHLFAVNQQVLLKDFRRKKRKGGKLGMRYIGPYKIIRVTRKGTYHLEHVVSGKTAKAIGSHLKLYVPKHGDESG